MISSEFDLTLVTKPWGFEFELFDNEAISIWCVSIGKEHKSGYLFDSSSTSCHMHTQKTAKVLILDGAVELFINNQPIIVNTSSPFTIPPRTPHQLQAYHGNALLLEVELPSNRGDIVRFSDSYGRSKSTYCWDLLDSNKITSWRSELHNKNTPYDITISGSATSPKMCLSNGVSVEYVSKTIDDILAIDQKTTFIVTEGTIKNSLDNIVSTVGDIIDPTFKNMLLKNDKMRSLYKGKLSGLLISNSSHEEC